MGGETSKTTLSETVHFLTFPDKSPDTTGPGPAPAREEPPPDALSLNLASIEALDPALASGHQVVYDREAPVEVLPDRETPRGVSALELLRCRVLVLAPGTPDAEVRIELTSERDLFFLYSSDLDAEGFWRVAEQQRLELQFDALPAFVGQLLDSCSLRPPRTHRAALSLRRGGAARLDFLEQATEDRSEVVLSVELVAGVREAIRAQLAFRYHFARGHAALAEARLCELDELTQKRDPELRDEILARARGRPRRGAGGSAPTGTVTVGWMASMRTVLGFPEG